MSLIIIKDFVERLTLFLLGLAPLQSLRAKYSVAWLVFVRFVSRICHQWHTSAIPLKTLLVHVEMQEGLQIGTSQIIINGSTTKKLHHQLPSSSEAEVKIMKESTTVPNHEPRMNRISSIVSYELPPQIPRVLGILRYLKYLLRLI
jgi:hypothetical protein